MKKTWTVVAVLAVTLAVVSGSSATVRGLITGADIKAGSITSREVKDGSLGTRKLSRDAINALHGATGRQGSRGATGPQGPAGPQGIAGSQGATGATGSRGPAGADGTSGGTPGPKGDTGATGATGTQGPKGDTGTAGTAGAAGAAGADGAQGPKGDTGAKGDPGADGVSNVYATSTSTPGDVDSTQTFTILSLSVPGGSSYLLIAKLNFTSVLGTVAHCFIDPGDGGEQDSFLVDVGNYNTSNSLFLPYTFGAGTAAPSLKCSTTSHPFTINAARLVAVQSQNLTITP